MRTLHQPLKDSSESEKKNVLIVSLAETWQYRCPSYNQQRATLRGEKNPKTRVVTDAGFVVQSGRGVSGE